MSEKDKNVPKIRFKEFKDAKDWEKSTIGKSGYFYYGKSAPKWSVTKDAKTPCVRYGELYTKHAEKIEKIYSYTNIPIENLKFSTGKEVLVPRVGEDPIEFANCSWLSIPDVAIGEMISVYNTDHNPLFTAYMFNALFKYEFAKRVEGGNVSNLYYAYLENIPVSFPCIDEQEKISNYLDKLTKIINLHKIKLEKLKKLKKAYLMEMFPAEGEFKPRRRFPGFTDDWEEYEFSYYYKVCSGYAFKYQDYTEDGVAIINGETIQHGKVESTKFNYLPTSFKAKYDKFILKEGDIVIGLNRPITDGQLKIARVPRHLDDSLLYQRAGKIKYINDINDDFSFVLLEKEILKHTLKEAVGSDQPFISTSKLDKWTMLFPKSDEERFKIGAYFKSLDNIINIHQCKLDKLQSIKKAYLNEMFI